MNKERQSERKIDRGIEARRNLEVVKNLGWAGWMIVVTIIGSAMTAAYQAGESHDEIQDLELLFKSELSKQAAKSANLKGFLVSQFDERDQRYASIIEQRNLLLAGMTSHVATQFKATDTRISEVEKSFDEQVKALWESWGAQLQARDIKLDFVYTKMTEGDRFTMRDGNELRLQISEKCAKTECDRMQKTISNMEVRCLDTQKKIAVLWERVMSHPMQP